jgi:hypothetical protein
MYGGEVQLPDGKVLFTKGDVALEVALENRTLLLLQRMEDTAGFRPGVPPLLIELNQVLFRTVARPLPRDLAGGRQALDAVAMALAAAAQECSREPE